MINNKKTVLLVEDEVALQEAAKLKLEESGMKVLPATNGEEALAILKKTKPDFVWLDILLPGIDGFGVLKTIREDQNLKDLPVMIVSVSSSPEKIQKALSSDHITDYIVKSNYKLGDIIKKVVNVLNDKKSFNS